MGTPEISVVIPCYNHAAYVGQAIASALAQDFGDFELIVSDNASADASWDVIRSFSDPRVRPFRQERNIGCARNYFFCLSQAKGRYFAVLCSDDYWAPSMLSKQLAPLRADPSLGVSFSWAERVYSGPGADALAKAEAHLKDHFKVASRGRAAWLRGFFEGGNHLCNSNALIRREASDFIHGGSWGLRQLPDLWSWAMLLKRYGICVVEEVLGYHRRTGSNVSSGSLEDFARLKAEYVKFYKDFFVDMPPALFVEAFGDLFRRKGVSPDDSAALFCESVFLLLDHAKACPEAGSIAAIELLLDAYEKPGVPQVLERDYSFSYADLHKLTGTRGFASLIANQIRLQETVRMLSEERDAILKAVNERLPGLLEREN